MIGEGMAAPDSRSESQAELLLLALGGGSCVVGEVLVEVGFSLRHREDRGRDDLEVFTDHVAARNLAKYDSSGSFRPLKSAPGLRRGWMIRAEDPAGVLLALEEFYPAAVGLWLSFLQGAISPTGCRETLDRQTGMYRRAGLIGDDQIPSLIAARCRSQCLRIPLWHPAGTGNHDFPVPGRIPLLCREACNLLVSDALDVVRRNSREENQPPP